MYSVSVRHHAFIAHSLKKDVFGPARNLHGVTLLVDARFTTPRLDGNNTVMDVVTAARVLKDVLGEFSYRNLDEIAEFRDQPTTMEFMARRIHDGIAGRVGGGFHGRLKVSVRESPEASAAYEADIPARPGPGREA